VQLINHHTERKKKARKIERRKERKKEIGKERKNKQTTRGKFEQKAV
jgi:hypothetical protein